MILILEADLGEEDPRFRQLMAHLQALAGIQSRVHREQGSQQLLTEIYLVGDTQRLAEADMQTLPGVERVVRISREYRMLGR
ncbi:MAG: 3-deoxy-7-phosphoheptulonate synthase, partial [Acidithiobacillus sp.]